MIAPAVAAALLAACVQAAPPPWLQDPCAGLDCRATPAGVGQADMLPEPRLTSAVAYAQAARSLSSAQQGFLAVGGRLYGETQAQAGDNAVKDLARSPLGVALTKVYGDAESDMISTAIELKPLSEIGSAVYAQEYADVSSSTLYVRLILARSAGFQPPAGFSLWPGGHIRMASEDVRVSRRNEFTLWVEDSDAGLTWVEHWPTGGGDLLKDGVLAAQYLFDPRGLWLLSSKKR